MPSSATSRAARSTGRRPDRGTGGEKAAPAPAHSGRNHVDRPAARAAARSATPVDRIPEASAVTLLILILIILLLFGGGGFYGYRGGYYGGGGIGIVGIIGILIILYLLFGSPYAYH